MIIRIPAIRSRRSQTVDPKEKARVLEYLDRYATTAIPEDLIELITKEVMLDRFGWGSVEGKIRTIGALQSLEKDGKIQCQREKKQRNPSVIRRIPDAPAPVARPAVKKKVVRPTPKVVSASVRAASTRKTKKGVARGRRKSDKLGLDNESRFHALMPRLVSILRATLSDTIIGAAYSHSGRHNPRKGKINLRDSHGEDGRLSLAIRHKDGGAHGEWLIYDVKSSRGSAQKFNANIRIFPGQEGAALKRAIVVNDRRSDRSIVQEVLADLVGVQVLPTIPVPVLDQFDN